MKGALLGSRDEIANKWMWALTGKPASGEDRHYLHNTYTNGIGSVLVKCAMREKSGCQVEIKQS